MPEELAFFEAQLRISVPDQSHDAIKKAYREFCSRHHSDKTAMLSGDKDAQRKKLFTRVKEVYDRLDAQERERREAGRLRMTRMARAASPKSVSTRLAGRHGTAGRPPFRM